MIDSELNNDNYKKKKETSYQLVHRNLMTVDAGDHHHHHHHHHHHQQQQQQHHQYQYQHQRNVHYSSSFSPPPPFSFELPPDLAAKEPPERRGIARDEVRLLVINRKSYETEHS